MKTTEGGGSSRRVANNLATAGSAAVLAVYVAGYVRTESAADRFARQVAAKRLSAQWEEPIGQTPSQARWKDGRYTGWGFSRHGDIEAAVTIEGGRIASAVISQCRTRYSCSVIANLPPQVAERQSPSVDHVSGATQSADAFYAAVVAALSKAR